MALYESTFIASQELTNKQVDDLVQGFVDFLKHAGGKLVKKEYWGVRNFAYAIKKQKKGHYTMLCIDCPIKEINKFDVKIRNREEVLKHYIVKVDSFAKEVSMLAKEKNE